MATGGKRDQSRLGPRLIDRVDQPGVIGYQIAHIVSADEGFDRLHSAAGSDTGYPLLHRSNLGGTQGRIRRMDLSIDVGLGNMIQIDQRETANSASCKRLGCPGPDASQPDHAGMRIGQAGKRSLAV